MTPSQQRAIEWAHEQGLDTDKVVPVTDTQYGKAAWFIRETENSVSIVYENEPRAVYHCLNWAGRMVPA